MTRETKTCVAEWMCAGLWLAPVAFSWACFDGASVLGLPCESHADCGSYVCVQQVCGETDRGETDRGETAAAGVDTADLSVGTRGWTVTWSAGDGNGTITAGDDTSIPTVGVTATGMTSSGTSSAETTGTDDVETGTVEEGGSGDVENCSGIVEFADPEFERVVRVHLGIDEGDIQGSRAAELTIVQTDSEGGIHSLEGAQCLTGLVQLRINDHRIESITPLAKLHQLQVVQLDNNQIEDLSPLAGLAQLRELSLFGNRIKDLTPLAHLKQLTELQLSFNPISDLTPIAGLHGLQQFDAAGAEIEDLAPLGELVHLRFVSLGSNRISRGLHALSGFQYLHSLTLADNELTGVAGLTDLPSLQYLNLENNQISAAAPFSGLSHLHRLNLKGNAVSDPSPLLSATRLTFLHLSANPIDCIAHAETMSLLNERIDIFSHDCD